MKRPIRYYVCCKFTGKNGKDVNVNKILLVSPKLNEREIKKCLEDWAETYIKKGYSNFRIVNI